MPLMLPLLACLFAAVAAEAAAVPPGTAELDEVVIVGKRVGPGLWKVSRGDHVLWLLGTPELLPARMEWDSSAVEAVMAKSQLRISGPRVTVKGGPLTWLRLYLQVRRMRQTDERSPLRATLPMAMHGRFELQRLRYAPGETGWEKLRPMLAADRLFEAAVDKSGLKGARAVSAEVDRLAERHHVPVNRVQMVIEEPQQLLRELAETPGNAELRCMESTLNRVETDMEASARRAAAWARGDIREIRSLSYNDNRSECIEAVAEATPRVKALMARGQQLWLEAVDAALAAHASTFATRPIQDLLRPDGVLATFAARGYRVEAP